METRSEPSAPERALTLRVGRAAPSALRRAAGGALVGGGLALVLCGWFPGRALGAATQGAALGACYGLAALLEAAGWGADRPSRLRRVLTACAVWVAAAAVGWAAQLEALYLAAGSGADVQHALGAHLDAVRDDPAPFVLLAALVGFPLGVLCLSEGSNVGRGEQAAAAFFGVLLPTLPVCVFNPVFAGLNAAPGFHLLLVSGLAALLPAVGWAEDRRSGLLRGPRADPGLVWNATLLLACSSAAVWAGTRLLGDARLDYRIVSDLRAEAAERALAQGQPERALEACRAAEEAGVSRAARDALRASWIEAAWLLDAPGPPGGLSLEEHAWVAGFLRERALRFRRAEARARRGAFPGALADLAAAHALPHAPDTPGGFAELCLLEAEVHARRGDARGARRALERSLAAALAPSDADLERVRRLLPVSGG